MYKRKYFLHEFSIIGDYFLLPADQWTSVPLTAGAFFNDGSIFTLIYSKKSTYLYVLK